MVIENKGAILSTKEVSERLGISTRRARELATQGTLESVGDGVRLYVTEESVRRFQSHSRRPGRLFSPRIAFAALYMLSGEEPVWLKAAEKYRLRKNLSTMDVPRLSNLCAKRAMIRDFWCRDSRLIRVSQSIRVSAATGSLAEDFDLTESLNVEGYISEGSLQDLITRAKLRSDFRPTNVRLHVTLFMPPGEGHMPIGVCAADLAESLDVRERSAGERMIGRLLEQFKQVIATKE